MKGKLILLISTTALAVASCFLFLSLQTQEHSSVPLIKQTEEQDPSVTNPSSAESCVDVTIVRDHHAGLTKPLLFADLNCESPELAPLKEKLNTTIAQLKSEGTLQKATVYFKELNTLRWIQAGDATEYYPASMLKIAVMLNVLKVSEGKPGMLDQRLQLIESTGFGVLEKPSKPLEKGKFYSVRELLEAMIVRSDNDATKLLFTVMDDGIYADMYAKLNIPQPHHEDFFYQLSPANMAKFYRILYNVSYLNENNSEYALKLLTQSEFNGGLAAGVPTEAKVAHKFGEHFTEGNAKQFHDSGIVYFSGSAYVVVIMTEGNELTQLERAVANLSEVCFMNRSGKAEEPIRKTYSRQA
ncbi:MAG: serine hydrolase [Flavobacteriales bacterium]|jgi:beta-lactamase class A